MLEYLILNRKLEAAKHFHQTSPNSIKQELLSNFDQGNRQQFMEIFNLLHKQSKLQFYIQVYFLIYHIHPSIRGKGVIPQQSKISFKDYLDTKGAELAKTNEFLQFYALPFIKKPLQHLAFKNLFKKEWVSNLKKKLEVFIAQQQQIMKEKISKFLEHSVKQSSTSGDAKILQQKVKEMQKINKSLFEEVKEFTEKYHILEESHRFMIERFHLQVTDTQSKWFQITKQLVASSKVFIELLISSDSIYLSDKRFIKAKKRTEKYQKFVTKKFDDLMSQSQDISIFQRPSINQLSYSVTPYTQKSFLANQNSLIESYIPINHEMLKNFFKKGSIDEKISVINGFYWRILKSKGKQIRKLNIFSLIYYDILGIRQGVLQNLLTSRQLMKPILRLIQLISLDNQGKKLLFSKGNVQKVLIKFIIKCQDLSCLQYIVYTLGQISSEKCFKKDLIQEDIVEVCVGILRGNKFDDNQLILENTVAILLNMLERDEGLRKFEREKDIFDILKKHIKIDFKITRALIYGIVYALLESHELFMKAKSNKMHQFFENILAIDPHINKVQHNFLMNKLQTFQPKQHDEQTKNNQEDEDLSDYDDFEMQDQHLPDIEELQKCHGDIYHAFTLRGRQAVKQTEQIKELLEEYKDNHVPKFKDVPQNNKVEKISSPQIEKSSQINQTPYIKQQIEVHPQVISSDKLNSKRVNNLMAYQCQKSKIKGREVKNDEQSENGSERRMEKSKSADRGIGKNIKKDDNFIYQSNKFPGNQVSEFKSAQQMGYRSPQQQKKPRQQVLKQLNQQLKAQEVNRDKKKGPVSNMRENHIFSNISQKSKRNEEQGGAFQSRPKLRRTPPKQSP